MQHFRNLEAGIVARKSDVGDGGNGAAEAERAALDYADDRDRAVANSTVSIEHDVGESTSLQCFRLGAGWLQPGPRRAADAKIPAGAAQQHHARASGRGCNQVSEFQRHRIGHGIAVLGPVDSYA
jgi:hypothetical protein